MPTRKRKPARAGAPAPSAILARAREQLSWRPWWNAPVRDDRDREAHVQRQARKLALSESEIGRAAVAIWDALDSLIEGAEHFSQNWPDGAAAEEAGREALDAAGLDDCPAGGCYGGQSDEYSGVALELRRWLPVLELVRDQLEACEPPNTDTAPNEVRDEPIEHANGL